MDAVLLQRLSQITEEERELLQGRGVDRALYASGRAFEVDAAKMLEKGKLMSIRPHTRFAPFPRHSHNYVEIMYMCRGKTVHRIDGDALVTLEAGELLFLNRHASHAIQRADAGDIAVNFIVLPQFFDEAFNMAGMDNVRVFYWGNCTPEGLPSAICIFGCGRCYRCRILWRIWCGRW